jgi:hypothetical protein
MFEIFLLKLKGFGYRHFESVGTMKISLGMDLKSILCGNVCRVLKSRHLPFSFLTWSICPLK